MRRLSMKSKRRKSETTSDSGSEENGVARTATTDSNEDMREEKESEETEASSAEKPPALKKTAAKRRPSRGRHSQKATSEEPVGEARNDEDTQAVADTEEEENGNVGKGGASKRRKKEEHKASTSSQDASAGEKEYEVEKIVGQRTIKGRRQFLVRWKGYGEDSDTWEQEKDLNCSKLIEQYLTEEGDSEQDTEPEKPAKSLKNKSPKTEKKSKKPKATSRKHSENDKQILGTDEFKPEKESQKEFEVEKIIEVHFRKNKAREFLIRWKGFTSADDTWEPEENLNCPELISKFMQKVEKAKTTDMRELRTNRAHTKRYTLTTHETGRRLSRRNMDKQRATYHECDE